MSMIEHLPIGDPCTRCGQPASGHRKRRNRQVYFKEYDGKRSSAKRRKDSVQHHPIIGIDGEGITTPDGRHLYTYIAAVDEHGKVWGEAFNQKGLSHDDCMDVLLDLPRDSLKFGYMISYDVTKILEELPMVERYYLMRPDKRRTRTCKDCKHKWTVNKSGCPKCKSHNTQDYTPFVSWKGKGYNFQPGSFTFADGMRKITPQGRGNKRKWTRSVKIWDCFRFFQCAFVQALKNWDVGTKEERDQIQAMKVQRGTFVDVDPQKVREYCQRECQLLAIMMRKVIDSHNEVELDLAGQYQGAGATASALLKKYNVADYKTEDFPSLPGELQYAAMCSFFGGRFENSIVGVVRKPVFGRDIASAYPYAETFLPCLKCGKWRLVRGRGVLRAIEQARLACCHYRVLPVPKRARHEIPWMPLPFRDEKGSICYPTNCTGWAWKPELLSAISGWPDLVEVDEAWIYDTECDHQPFAFIPEVYMNRVKWGKEGKGIVLKLGSNATYGKTAQNVGRKPFQDWIWAGNTTAYTRGQINTLICAAKDRWNVMSIATDGIYGVEDLECPKPVDTGTWGLVDSDGKDKEALGGWERKDVPEGMFIAKPGLYYGLTSELELKDVRARGVGRRDIFEQRQKLIERFLGWDRQDFNYKVPIETRRFYGIKHSIYAQSGCSKCETSWTGCPRDCCPECGRIGDKFRVSQLQFCRMRCEDCGKMWTDKSRKKCPDCNGKAKKFGTDAYGLWFDMTTDIRFDPSPKRERSLDQTPDCSRLRVRDVDGQASAIYKAAQLSPEAFAAVMLKEMLLEQPDIDED
jgi:hypothetical protein